MFSGVKKFWKGHGTKIIGTITALGGSAAALDPATVAAILTAIAGDRGPGIATGVVGLMTLWRGFTNTKAEKAKEQS